MNPNNLQRIFDELKAKVADSEDFYVEEFDSSLPHRLGCTIDGHPIFFIECADETKQPNIKLSVFSVMFNRSCNVVDAQTGNHYVKKYTVIQLSSDDVDFQYYFLSVVYLVLKGLAARPDTTALNESLLTLISLFANDKRPSAESIRGLFAELVVIYLSSDVNYLLKSWHVTPQDKYDFNDGIDKVEVKSTKQGSRLHTFSMEQLLTTANSSLVVASIAMSQVGAGMNVYELAALIDERLSDINLSLKLHEIIAQTAGKHFEEVSKFRFDFGMSTESYALYDSIDIPKIQPAQLAPEIKNVHFSVDLAGIQQATSSSYTSKLISSLA